MTRLGVAVFALLGAAIVPFWIHAVGQGAEVDWSPLYDGVLYNVPLAGGAVICVAQALRAGERLPWLLLGLGLGLWAAGDILYSFTATDAEFAPFPAPSDYLYLVAYPVMAAGLVVLARRRLPRPRLVVWIDGAVVALCVTAATLAVMSQALAVAWDEDTLATAVLLGLPIGNALLLGLVAGVLALSGGVPPRGVGLLAVGLCAVAVADLVSTHDTLVGAGSAVNIVSGLWPAGGLLVAAAAWQPAVAVDPHALDRLRSLYMPLVAALAALGIMVADHFLGIAHLPYALAAAAVLAVVARAALALTDSLRRLAGSRTEARTDALTGLGNRRQLLDDLTEATADATPAPRVLLLLDLDGFKQYNDTNGHPAGDALLATLGAALRAAVATCGTAYRLGGDEFCVLATPDVTDIDGLAADARDALSHVGDDGRVSASCGAVTVGLDARTPAEALQVADERLYSDKNGRRAGATADQVGEVLVRALDVGDPERVARGARVAELATAVGWRMGLPAAEIHAMAMAARLRDLGRLAGHADAAHVLRGAPALSPVASILEALAGSGDRDRPTTVHIIEAATAVDDMFSAGASATTAAAELFGGGFDGGTVRAMTEVLANR